MNSWAGGGVGAAGGKATCSEEECLVIKVTELKLNDSVRGEAAW